MNKFVSKLIAIVALVIVAPVAYTNAQTPTLSVTCNAQQESAYIGDTVTWEAHVTGGEAPYSYSWSASALGGQENPISGNSATASKTYTAAGSYGAHITVSDSTFIDVVSIECAPRLTIIAPLEFASCTPSETASNTGYETTWTVKLTGGIAPYGFSLSGTDGLSSGTSPAKITYTTAGVKTATVSNIFSSDGQAVVGSWACTSATVESAPTALKASCSADDSSVKVDDEIVWSVSASGGKAPYSYSWSGTDGLSGSATSTKKTYTKAGDKTAEVDVASADGQLVSNVSCDATVAEKTSNNDGGGSSSGSSRNSSSNSNTTVTTATTNTNPISRVTLTNNSNGTGQTTSTSGVNATSTATTTDDVIGNGTSTNEIEGVDRTNQLASASILGFFKSSKFWAFIFALILAIAIRLIFFKKKKEEEQA